MKQSLFTVIKNEPIVPGVMKMVLSGNTEEIINPGQFVNIMLGGLFLRRPISVCDLNGSELTIIYKIVGDGTKKMSESTAGEKYDILSGLGNGYDLSRSGDMPLLIGGGVGIPPLFWAAKKLVAEGKQVTAILGFNTKNEIFLKEEFENIGVKVIVTTVDGTFGTKGFVTDAMMNIESSFFYTCGPEPMLKAVYRASRTDGQFSFERRMGCGFGACMGCSCKTITGNKRICKEGPVMNKEDIIWED